MNNKEKNVQKYRTIDKNKEEKKSKGQEKKLLSSFKCSLHFHIAYFGIEFSSFHQIIKKQCEKVKQSNNDFFGSFIFFLLNRIKFCYLF